MAPHSRCFTVATMPRPPNEDVRRQWKKHLNRRRFSVRDNADGSDKSSGCAQDIATQLSGSPVRGDLRSPEPDRQHHVPSNTMMQNHADTTQTIATANLAESPTRGLTSRVSLSPVVGTLLKASWESSDSSSGSNSPSASPPPAEADFGVGLEPGPGEVPLHDQVFRSDPPGVQSLVAVITPRKVRFRIERVSPERTVVRVRGGSSSPSPPAESAQPSVPGTEPLQPPVCNVEPCPGPSATIPQINSFPLLRTVGHLTTYSDNNPVPIPEALASTSTQKLSVSPPLLTSQVSSSAPRTVVSTSQFPESSLRFPPPSPWPAPPTTSSLNPTVSSSTPPRSVLLPPSPWFGPPSETTASPPSTVHDPSQAQTTGWRSFHPFDTSLGQDDSMWCAPSPHIPAFPSSPSCEPDSRHPIPIDDTPRPLPPNLVPTFVAHHFRAGEQDGYTRSFKTSASFPLSHPPSAGEWQLGDVFLHEQSQSGDVQVWIWDAKWVLSREYDPHPTLPDRYLYFRSKLEPSWVKGQTIRSYKSRRRRKEGQLLARGKAKAR